MKITDMSSFNLPPGRLTVWRACAPCMTDAAWGSDGRRASYVQEAHLTYARETAAAGALPPSWLGCAFDLPAELDADAFATALCDWINRHENLRSHLAPSAHAMPRGALQRRTLPVEAVHVTSGTEGDFTDGRALTQYLEDLFDRETSPLGWPAYVFATVSRPDATTVLIATDHVLTDGYSTLRSAHEIHTLYTAALTTHDGKPALPPVTVSYPDFAEAERSTADALTAEHESIVRWRRFVTEAGGRLPVFPVPVSDTSGSPAAQPCGYIKLLDEPAARAFDYACRQAGGDSFSGLLACLAKVGHDSAGTSEFRTMSPFTTCADSSRSIGWYVGMGPIAFRLTSTDSFAIVLRSAIAALDGVKALACIPMSRVEQLLGMPLCDPFMVSYSDFRRMPGARHWNTWRTVILRSRTNAPDDVYFWVFRTHDGLFINYRHPATHQAYVAVPDYVARTKHLMASVASTARWPSPNFEQENVARDGHQAHSRSIV